MTKLSLSNGQFGTLNKQGGFVSQGTGSITFTDIAESKQGRLFGITFNSLFRLNNRSGSVTPVGNLGRGNMNALGFDNKNQLYGAGGSGFYRINTRTGKAKLVKNISGFLSTGDLAFHATRDLFFATSASISGDELFAISRQGKATRIGNIGFSNVFGLTLEQGKLTGYTPQGQQIRINIQTGKGRFQKRINGLGTGSIYGAT